MHPVQATVSELATYFEKGGPFDQAWRARPGLKILPRAYLLRRSESGFEANVSNGSLHILVSGQAVDAFNSTLAFEVRGKTLGYTAGCLTVPLLGIGLIVLLKTAVRSRSAKKVGEQQILPIVRAHFHLRPPAPPDPGFPRAQAE